MILLTGKCHRLMTDDWWTLRWILNSWYTNVGSHAGWVTWCLIQNRWQNYYAYLTNCELGSNFINIFDSIFQRICAIRWPTYQKYKIPENCLPSIHLDNLHRSYCLSDEFYPFVCVGRCFPSVKILAIKDLKIMNDK